MARKEESGIERLAFEVLIPAHHPCLPGHFPGNPIVPGALLLDAIVAELERITGLRTTGLQQVKFLSVLRPEETVLALCEVDGNTATFRASTRSGTAAVALINGTLSLQDAPAQQTRQ